MLRRVSIVALVLLSSLGPSAASRIPKDAARELDQISSDTLRSYVQALASDDFRGRGVGDEGNRAAERFIVGALRAEHVPPGAGGSYLQDVELVEPQLGADARLTVTAASGDRLEDLPAGTDFLPLPESGDARVTAPLASAGFGISAPEVGYDDYVAHDVRGKVVLLREGLPDGISESTVLADSNRDDLSSIERRLQNARVHGAAGVLFVTGSMTPAATLWPAVPSVRAAEYRLASDFRAHREPVAELSVTAARALNRALAAGQTLSVTFAPDVHARHVTVHNVLGFVEGRDPQRRSAMVVLGAHLDHEGTDAAGQIYNGADDNASGTAAVVAVAGAFVRAASQGVRPATAVLFALWNAEEEGELGAQHFVDAPEPSRQIVANINLDMVGRHEDVPDTDNWQFRGLRKTDAQASANTLHLLGYTLTPDLARIVADANTAVGLTLLEDYDRGAQNLLERSDHWPFLSHGIPAVFLTTGMHPDYHTPTDDVEKIDFAKLERVARLAARATWLAADGPPPHVIKARTGG